MDKKSLVILLVASSFTGSTFATNIINKISIKHPLVSPSMVKTHKTTHHANRPFTNFSGTWIVNCGDGASMQIVIENDADYISLDGDVSRIGNGLTGQSESNIDYTSARHTSFEWNAEGSALIMRSVEHVKENADNSPIQADVSKFTLAMKNGQIILDGTFVMLEDTTQIVQAPEHCVFTKKE